MALDTHVILMMALAGTALSRCDQYEKCGRRNTEDWGCAYLPSHPPRPGGLDKNHGMSFFHESP